MSEPEMTGTLQEARDWTWPRRHEGVVCPCCEQYFKTYKRTITAGMAHDLIAISRTPVMDNDWVNIKDVVGMRGGDYGKLKFWGILEAMEGTKGVWRLTQLGLKFINDRARVPRHAHIRDDKLEGFSGPEIGIREALGNKFDYARLMAGIS